MARQTDAIATCASFIAIAWSLCVGACSAAPGDQPTDQFGNVYPPECRRDLSEVAVPVINVQPQVLQIWARALHKPLYSRMYAATIAREVILVDETVRGWKRDDLIHHERCHVVAGNWHS